MDDQNDKNIHFDQFGICNYCKDFDDKKKLYTFTESQVRLNLEEIKKKISYVKSGEYDLITGVSGGVDSSYLIHLIKELKLKPLVIHFDNGWNSDLAVTNIKNLLDKTNFDYITEVIDWNEFKSLQRSFIKAGVVDIELLTDHAITATLFKYAKKYKIRTIFSGANFATEHGMPDAWAWQKSDLRNILDINKNFENIKLITFPTFNTLSALTEMFKSKYKLGNWYQKIEPLNLINYKKNDAIETLNKEYNWVYYGEKHYESTFTEFYQAYILIKKFKIDKRKPHISSLIRNGEIYRKDALEKIKLPPYINKEIERKKRDYFLKKIGMSDEDFEKILSSKPKMHLDYKNEYYIFQILQFYRRFLNPKNVLKKIWKRF
tara:strand:+ start:493 stop:1620 length:1128 start_codon:yes stop_codon:yes gene_type:complete